MTVAQLISEIQTAFDSVELEDGIGLWESQVIDDYGTEDERKAARKMDVRDDWRSIGDSDLSTAHSSLSFVDEKGMRFLLPAYMIYSFKPDTGFDPVFALTQSLESDCMENKFKMLNSLQRTAVRHYLEWALASGEFEFERPHIQKALNEYWLE